MGSSPGESWTGRGWTGWPISAGSTGDRASSSRVELAGRSFFRASSQALENACCHGLASITGALEPESCSTTFARSAPSMSSMA